MSYQNDALFRFLRGEEAGGNGLAGGETPQADERNGCSERRCESLAMVYAPEQAFQNLYESEEALCRGTLFCELEKPFWGAGRGK